MTPALGAELWRHRFHLAGEQQIQEQCFQDVIAMMTQSNLGRAQLRGHSVEVAAPESGTERTGGLAFGDQSLDDRVGVARFDVKRHASRGEIVREYMRRKARLLLVQIDGNDVEMDRGAGAQGKQNLQEPVAVFSAGEADHDLVAVFDHAVVGDGLSCEAAEARVDAFDLL